MRLISRKTMTRPSFVEGSGPFPASRGAITGDVRDDEWASLAALHLALMSDQSLSCIQTHGPIVIEGRFAEDDVYCAALAALRPKQTVFRSGLADGVALGAARLNDPHLAPQTPLEAVAPLAADFETYRTNWLHEIARSGAKH